MALALPSGSAIPVKSPRKEKKRKRPKKDKKDDKDKDLDSDAELEVSAEDLVAAGETARREDDAEEDEDEDIAGQVAVDVKQAAKRRRDETLLLRGVLDEEQGRRFDAFRGTVIPRAAVNKLNRDMYDQHVPKNIQPVLAGLLKIFVADVVEIAREIQPHTAHPTGPLQPYHLQMARVRLQEQGLLSAPSGIGAQRSSTGLRARKPLFRR
ncbi:hypothetical protein CcaverHIS002_0505130 [Cutaneotrichosporon cavernicola]|uniref:TAFII28-like protein domain-containing protein n=1 Tax=Cutaneotrichosporon cavernicola TaxID=279322 RepID=A0AA48L6M9_9TREE|nr:uncharacterized protein CcaverHIS019_0505650 [Cutaneotrichosporon cavernicola]BEI85112.1 hypothetical protein CcaverHIS002_0505130 [Cutaneotrichosporon cavernicola]BEI92937.1 hypothetical protein CcaverHIS019_0505650 [Cutaneotrichosporon cavernicola]BEJ00713.1 hypothetical protein CcaverHIS631_0505700 [Cutaneotrichosporon cavernicola]BEJ08480.1 hypothetical protein CcaverHIS641_0505740 [Cutaneotrichosporon cavernicola]